MKIMKNRLIGHRYFITGNTVHWLLKLNHSLLTSIFELAILTKMTAFHHKYLALGLMSLSWMSKALDLTQMVMDILK